MHKYFFITKDNFINSGSNGLTGEDFKDKNVGQDEVLELKKYYFNRELQGFTRLLIQFDTDEIKNYITSSNIPSDYKLSLRLYETEGTSGLSENYTIVANPLTQSWDEGIGKESDEPKTTQGCSWKYVDGDLARQQNKWVSGSSIEGPRWYSGSAEQYSLESTASIGKHSDTHDVRFDVSGIVKNWIYSGSTYVNHGFIVMRDGNFGATDTGSAEKDGIDRGHLKFFSTETNTIFPPRLEVEYDDSSFSTGSLLPLTGSGLEDAVIYTKNLRETYMEKSTPKIRIGARERFAERAVSTQSPYSTVKYLPSGSRDLKDGAYYSIKDADSDFTLVPFSTGSIISCDSDGNYFKVDMNSFQVDRVYKFIFKVISGSGTSEGFTNLYDDNYTFRVTK